MTEKAGERNLYTCTTCGGFIVTVIIDDGTTPSGVACRSTPGCKGRMESHFYPKAAETMEPGYEWYRPTKQWARRKGAEMADYVERGGLALRLVGMRS